MKVVRITQPSTLFPLIVKSETTLKKHKTPLVQIYLILILRLQLVYIEN